MPDCDYYHYYCSFSPLPVHSLSNYYCSGHHLIEFLMVKWGLKCEKLVDGFAFLPSQKASKLSGNIQLAEIVLNCGPVKVT